MESVTLSHNNVNLSVKKDSETFKLINDTPNASQYTSEVSKALLTNENTEEKQAESNFKWTQSLIVLLIDIRKREEPKFNESNTEEKQLWQNIADEINNITNVGVTGDMCDVKYRELSTTYKANKEKQKCTRKNSSDNIEDTLEEYLGDLQSSEVHQVSETVCCCIFNLVCKVCERLGERLCECLGECCGSICDSS